MALPDTRWLPSSNFSANGDRTVFTVAQAGDYRVTFDLRLQGSAGALVWVEINGTESDKLKTDGVDLFHGDAVVTLGAGDTLSLGILTGGDALDNVGPGASLIVERVG